MPKSPLQAYQKERADRQSIINDVGARIIERQFNKAIELAKQLGDTAEGYCWLGQAYYEQAKDNPTQNYGNSLLLNRALENLNNAIKYPDTPAQAYRIRGYVHFAKGNYSKAALDFAQAKDNEPYLEKHLDAWFEKAIAHRNEYEPTVKQSIRPPTSLTQTASDPTTIPFSPSPSSPRLQLHLSEEELSERGGRQV